MLSISALQQFLHDHIPLSTTMGVEVLAATPDGVTLAAPLEPNINHLDTVFGGSSSAVAILSAWGLLYVRLREEFPNASIVIQRNTMRYQRPISSAFTASSFLPDPAAWDRFTNAFRRKNRARLSIGSLLYCNGEQVGELDAAFVALGLKTA